MSERERPPRERWMATVGAVIFASDEPVPIREIAETLGADDVRDAERAVDELAAALREAGVGVRLEKVAGGYQFATDSAVGAWVRHFFRQRNRARLTPAALETLAIVAYRQPVTAPEIQSIRGKDPSAALKSLLDKKMIRILGKKKVVGTPLLYGTSKTFLVHFGLDSLKDLPALADFEEFAGALDEGQLGPFRVSGDAPDLLELSENGDGEHVAAEADVVAPALEAESDRTEH